MKTLYTATVKVTGGREGRVVSSDGVLDLQLGAPKEMGGSEGDHTNPEQLFAAGYAACFNSAVMLAARRKKIDADNVEVQVAISIAPDSGSYKLSARIDAKFHGINEQEAQTLMEEAHNLCPYSKATRGNIDVDMHFTIE